MPDKGLTRAEIDALVNGSTDAELREILANLPDRATKKVKASKGPQTDDELHEWIVRETGYNIPRVAVCEGHRAPFDFVADAYFERKSALFLLGSREMGKTLSVAVIHYANSKTKPGCESITFGAIDEQARRAYRYIKQFVFTTDDEQKKIPKDEIAGIPMRRETHWKNGSLVEIIVGSASGVNSPHDQKVHADEVDLMERLVWDESRNISSSKTLADGTVISAQDFATSTRKSMHGLVQEIIDECDSAKASGFEPPWEIYESCVFEASKEVPNCRRVDPLSRTIRLTELGLDTCSLCDCNLVAKGEWSEGVPRTLERVCSGKFFRSRGWMRYEDIKRKFRNNTQSTWEAQMECTRPMADGLYLPSWTRERYTVRNWVPRGDLGQNWLCVDWGGSASSAVLWFQGPLRVPVSIAGAGGNQVTVPMGAYVFYGEIVIPDIGATKLADMVVTKEITWRRQVPSFRVVARFPDMAGKQQRNDWREHNPPLRTVSYLPNRDFDPTVKNIQGVVEDGNYWVDSEACPRHCDDLEAWRQKAGKEVHDESSHTPAAARYGMANVIVLERRRVKKGRTSSVTPVVVGGQGAQAPTEGPDLEMQERAWRGMDQQPLPGPGTGGRWVP